MNMSCKSETIVIVDDEQEIADLLEVYLKNESYVVRKFYNPLDALACIEKEPVSLACCLIEGYSMFHCIRKHLIVTVIYYVVVVVGLRFVSMTMQVSLNYLLLLVAFIGELAITLSVSRGYTKNNLYQIVKGAE